MSNLILWDEQTNLYGPEGYLFDATPLINPNLPQGRSLPAATDVEAQLRLTWEIFTRRATFLHCLQRFNELGKTETDGRIEVSDLSNATPQMAGFFKDVDDFVNAVMTADCHVSSKVLYLRLNPVKSSFSRGPSKFLPAYSQNLPTDDGVESRQYILVDIDSSGSAAASDEALQATWLVRDRIYTYLKSLGFPEPLFARSGNGSHLLYAYDARVNHESNVTVQHFLKSLLLQFGPDSAAQSDIDEAIRPDIDTTVGNASRLTKIYGTMTRNKLKFETLDTQPARRSFWEYIPREVVPVNDSLLLSVIQVYRLSVEYRSECSIQILSPSNAWMYSPDGVQSWLNTHGIKFVPRHDSAEFSRWIIDCPFNPSHKGEGAVLWYNGRMVYRCHHNSCADHRWTEFRALYEPEAIADGAFEVVLKSPDSAPASKLILSIDDFDISEGGIADICGRLYGEDWRYSPALKSWFIWTGTHWDRDTTSAVFGAIDSLLYALTQALSTPRFTLFEEKAELTPIVKAYKAMIDSAGAVTEVDSDDTKPLTADEKMSRDRDFIQKLQSRDDSPLMKQYRAVEKRLNAVQRRIKAYDDLKELVKRQYRRVISILQYLEQVAEKVEPSQFEQLNVLNLPNGTIELDGEFIHREPRRQDLGLHCLPYLYDPQADCPRFRQFLNEVLVTEEDTSVADTQLIALFQEALGYSLTNETRYEGMFWLTGSGANGKSVSLRVIQALLDKLVVSVDIQSMGKSGNYDLADIWGKRVILSSESRESDGLPEEMIKKLVSGDTIQARGIYEKPFNFVPRAKIWWALNNKPRLKDTGHSSFRRLNLLPYHRTFKAHEKDVHLTEVLSQELPGILNFALEGLSRLRRQKGFSQSEASKSEIQGYRAELDSVVAWYQDRTRPAIDPEKGTVSSVLYKDYTAWCTQTGRAPFGLINFGHRLVKIDNISVKTSSKDDEKKSGSVYNIKLMSYPVSNSLITPPEGLFCLVGEIDLSNVDDWGRA